MGLVYVRLEWGVQKYSASRSGGGGKKSCRRDSNLGGWNENFLPANVL